MMNNEMVNVEEGHVHKGQHQTPDETYGEQSDKNRIKSDVQHSANPSSDGQLRK